MPFVKFTRYQIVSPFYFYKSILNKSLTYHYLNRKWNDLFSWLTYQKPELTTRLIVLSITLSSQNSLLFLWLIYWKVRLFIIICTDYWIDCLRWKASPMDNWLNFLRLSLFFSSSVILHQTQNEQKPLFKKEMIIHIHKAIRPNPTNTT